MTIPALAASPLFGLTITVVIFSAAKWVYTRTRIFLLHPVLVSIAVIIVILKIAKIDYTAYMNGGSIINFFLAPSVVALGLPLYENLSRLREHSGTLILTTLFASIVGITASILPAIIFGANSEVLASLAPKSVTTPIAMVISRGIGGLPSLTATVVVLSGVVGAVVGPIVLRLVGITGGIAFGFALGTASHGIGTARAIEAGQLEGASSSLALCLNGILTAVLTPLIVRLIV
jgi:predicted murein hydrolase (TIGR00659 family)